MIIVRGALILMVTMIATGSAPGKPDDLDLILLTGNTPVRLELRVQIDGKTVSAIWDEAFSQLLAFHDRDGNGSLDRTEVGRLPSPFVLRQALWGMFTPGNDEALPFKDLDRNGDNRVERTELADYHQRAGLGNILVGIGKPPATQRLTDALLRYLDTSKDGQVDETEVRAAGEKLLELDANDDELIGPGELVERTAYPGALGSMWLEPTNAENPLERSAKSFPLMVLPNRTLASLQTRPGAPTTSWEVRLGAGKDEVGLLERVGGIAPATGRLLLTAGSTRLSLRADAGKLPEQFATIRKKYLAQFKERDTNGDGVLDSTESGAPSASRLRSLVAVADRNDDGKLSEQELVAWLNFQAQIIQGQVLLTVLDHGAGLFELLDADHDGSLSVRELRTAWSRLESSQCIVDSRIERSRLPRHLLATVSRGHPQAPLGKHFSSGPDWFRAMDRNGDGDVSRREFVGPTSLFDKLDTNRDGLLDHEEASLIPLRSRSPTPRP